MFMASRVENRLELSELEYVHVRDLELVVRYSDQLPLEEIVSRIVTAIENGSFSVEAVGKVLEKYNLEEMLSIPDEKIRKPSCYISLLDDLWHHYRGKGLVYDVGTMHIYRVGKDIIHVYVLVSIPEDEYPLEPLNAYVQVRDIDKVSIDDLVRNIYEWAKKKLETQGYYIYDGATLKHLVKKVYEHISKVLNSRKIS